MVSFFIFLLAAAGVCIGFILLVRKNSEEDKEHLTEEDRRVKIAANLTAGILVPLPVCLMLYIWASVNTRFLENKQWTLLIAGTLASMTGLPFIIRMLRLIRTDRKALWSAVFLGPYGLFLWFLVVLSLGMLFVHGCC